MNSIYTSTPNYLSNEIPTRPVNLKSPYPQTPIAHSISPAWKEHYTESHSLTTRPTQSHITRSSRSTTPSLSTHSPVKILKALSTVHSGHTQLLNLNATQSSSSINATTLVQESSNLIITDSNFALSVNPASTTTDNPKTTNTPKMTTPQMVAPYTIIDFSGLRSKQVTTLVYPTQQQPVYIMPDQSTTPIIPSLLHPLTTNRPPNTTTKPSTSLPYKNLLGIPLVGSESVVGTVAPSLMASSTTRRIDWLPPTRSTTNLPFGYKPRFVNRISILPIGSNSPGSASSRSLSHPTRHPPPDFTVFGILNNRTVVVRHPSLESTSENPHVIYGILPNNTVVRKFPNGSVTQADEGPRYELTDINANSLTNPNSELYRRQSLTEVFLSTVSTWASTAAPPPSKESHKTNSSSSSFEVSSGGILSISQSSSADVSPRATQNQTSAQSESSTRHENTTTTNSALEESMVYTTATSINPQFARNI